MPYPLSVCLRYVYATFVLINEYSANGFTSATLMMISNSPWNQNKTTGCHLDLCTHVHDDASMELAIYWKPTHTDWYLNFQLHHPLVQLGEVNCEDIDK